MPTIDDLATRLTEYLNPEQIQEVCRAYFYAEQAHDGQLRRSGEPYITHPLAVANLWPTCIWITKPDGSAAARCHRRHGRTQVGFGRAIWRSGHRFGRRCFQADQHAL